MSILERNESGHYCSGVVTYVILITGRVTGDIPHGGGSMWNVTSWTHHNHHNVTLQPQHDPRHPLYRVIRHVESARVGRSIVKRKSKSPCTSKVPNHNYQKYLYAQRSFMLRGWGKGNKFFSAP